MIYYKYKYADMQCDFCADKWSYACITELCPHIVENLPDLLDDDDFCEAVRNAERCRTIHRKTLICLKNNAAESAERCNYKPECRTCRYASNGFVCRSKHDVACLKDWLNQIKINGGEIKNEKRNERTD